MDILKQIDDYLTEKTYKTENVDHVNNGKILKIAQVERVSNTTIRTVDKISSGYFEDKRGHRYMYDVSMDGYNYYTII